MKKNVLALSIATMIGGLGFAGAASADVIRMTGLPGSQASTATQLNLAEGGVGHALIVPYFNAQNGNMTVLHVVNRDTTNGKAVKVRFRGAANSDDILDFQVFMSPGDVWTAAVTAGADGLAQLVTADNSCTLPKLTPNVPQAFITGRLNPALVGDALNGQTREGYIEIFNMADIPAKTTTLKDSLYETIKHVNGVAPCAPATLNKTLVNLTTEAEAIAAGFAAPTGTLMGDWYIQNVAQTTTYSGGATAVVATLNDNVTSAPSNFVHFPQADAAASAVGNTADPLFLAGGVTPANYDLPDLSTPFVTAPAAGAAITQASKLTEALAVKSISNQFANDAGIFAKTDWVFSMPTRRYSVAMNYTKLNSPDPIIRAGAREFTPLTKNWFVASNTTINGQLICVSADKETFWDREESSRTSGAVFSPDTVKITRFCGETSVMSFGVARTDTSALAASVAREAVMPGFINGWGQIMTGNNGNGLPIVGASFIKLSNANATPGTSGTYGITWPHRFVK